MKKISFVFIALILELLAFQNAYSEEEIRTRWYQDHSIRRYILWRVYTQPLDSNGKMYVSVDSALLEDFYTKEKFKIVGKGDDVKNLKPNAYYIVLSTAGCSSDETSVNRECFLIIQKVSSQAGKGDDYVLPDTPENRAFLEKKWRETKVTYDDPSSGRKVFVDINENRRENKNNLYKNRK